MIYWKQSVYLNLRKDLNNGWKKEQGYKIKLLKWGRVIRHLKLCGCEIVFIANDSLEKGFSTLQELNSSQLKYYQGYHDDFRSLVIFYRDVDGLPAEDSPPDSKE